MFTQWIELVRLVREFSGGVILMARMLMIVSLLLIIGGCSSNSVVNEEEEAKYRAEAERKLDMLVMEAVNPVLNITDASIMFYEDHGRWPVGDVTPGGNGKFLSYSTTQESENTLVTNFKLKALAVDWKLSLTYLGTDDEKSNSYNGSLAGYGVNGRRIVRVDDMKLSKGVSRMSDIKKHQLAAFFLFSDAISKLYVPPKKTSFSPIADSFFPFVAAVAICAVLDVNPRDCPLH